MKTRSTCCLILVLLMLGGCMLIGYDETANRDGPPDAGEKEAGAPSGDAETKDEDARPPQNRDAAQSEDAAPVPDGAVEDASRDGSEQQDALADAFTDDCPPSSSFCQGDKFVVCDENGDVASREDCALVEGDEQQCKRGACLADSGCVLQNAEDLSSCDDGLFCTTGEHCKNGECVDGSPNSCESAASACRVGVCNEETDRCESEPANQNGACGENATCNSQGMCVGGGELCSGPECALSCNANVSPCALDCGIADFCNAVCAAGANCNIDCAFTEQGCQVKCHQGSICDIDCVESLSCSSVICDPGAQCILRCAGEADSCSFSACEGGAQWCDESNAWVCHRDCP